MQLARNFAKTGKMGMQLEPGKIEPSIHMASTGWPIVLVLGVFFKLFGVSFAVGRIYEVIVLLALIILCYLLARKLWGNLPALCSLLLLVTFAPLYANGKMILSEGLGLLFLAAGLLSYVSERKKLGALLFGLFAACKLSFLATFAPAFGLALLWRWRKDKEPLKNLAVELALFVIAVVPTLVLVFSAAQTNVLGNIYGEVDRMHQLFANLLSIFHETTLIHLFGLSLVVLIALARKWRSYLSDWRVQMLLVFSLLTVCYWLLSPAVFRYLLPVQVIVLFVLPFVIKDLLPRWSMWLIVGLIVVQGVHFFRFSSTFGGHGYLDFENFVASNKFEGNIGVINSSFAPVLLPRAHMTQFFGWNNFTEGQFPLTGPQTSWPNYVFYEDNQFHRDIEPVLPMLGQYYKKVFDGEVVVWQKL